jgi:hypothetical protein
LLQRCIFAALISPESIDTGASGGITMAAKDVEFAYDSVSGYNIPRQRFVLDASLFQEVFSSKGEWRSSNVTRIPVVDDHNPAAGVTWIDAQLFSDGYLRGNVTARSGEIQSVVVDVSSQLAEQY